MSTGPHERILALLHDYGESIYEGDVARLRAAFHPRAMLYADVRGQPYRKTVDEYLDAVAARQSPRQRGEPYGMTVLSVEVTQDIAMARMRCVMLGFDYHDYLSLVRVDGRWCIVSKVFTDVGGARLVASDSA